MFLTFLLAAGCANKSGEPDVLIERVVTADLARHFRSAGLPPPDFRWHVAPEARGLRNVLFIDVYGVMGQEHRDYILSRVSAAAVDWRRPIIVEFLEADRASLSSSLLDYYLISNGEIRFIRMGKTSENLKTAP